MAEAKIQISAEDRFSRTLRDARSQFGDLQSSMGRLTGIARSVAGGFAAIGATFITGGLASAVKSVANQFDELNNSAQAAGVSMVALSELRTTAGFSGVGIQKLDDALTKLNVKIAEAAGGNKQAIQIFDALGISIRDAAGNVRGTEEVLGDVANSFRSFRDGVGKSAIAVKLFSETGAKLIPLLNQGSDSLRTFSGLTEETAKEGVRLQAELNKLSVTFDAFKNAILSKVVPATNEMIDVLGRVDTGKIGRAFLINPIGAGIWLPKAIADAKDELTAFNKVAEENRRLLNSPILAANVGEKPDAPVLAKDEEKVKKALTDSQRALQSYINTLKGRIQASRELLEVEKALEFLRDNPSIDTPRMRQQLLDQAAMVDKLGAEKQMREDIARITQRQAEEQANLREQILQFSGIADEERKRSLTAVLEEMINAGELTRAQAEQAVKGIAGIKDQVAETVDVAKELGLTFSSAFEDAIVSGENFRDMLKSLQQDILRLAVRQLITKPITSYFSDLFRGIAGTFGSSLGGSGSGAGLPGAGSGDLLSSPIQFARAGSSGVTVVNNIAQVGSNVSRADMLAAMDQTRVATIGQIADLSARGRLSLA